MGRVRTRFWVESALAAVCGVLAVLTAVVPDWIEVVLGTEPDGGDGSAEWLLVVILVAAFAVSAAIARGEWYRAANMRTWQ
jgi:hypothetical protein